MIYVLKNQMVKYEDKQDCEYKCILSKLDIEIEIWKVYIHKLLELEYTIYAKGGSILGIIVLKDLINYKVSEELINEYNDMNLIKDWNLTIINITKEQQTEIITLGEENIKNEVPVLRYKNGILINDENLLELSIKNAENYQILKFP